ncbi:4633_t:CDS:1, partial [Funneliformis caledonium]
TPTVNLAGLGPKMVGTGRENEEQGTIGLRPTTREGPSAGQGEGRYFIIRFPPFCVHSLSPMIASVRLLLFGSGSM